MTEQWTAEEVARSDDQRVADALLDENRGNEAARKWAVRDRAVDAEYLRKEGK